MIRAFRVKRRLVATVVSCALAGAAFPAAALSDGPVAPEAVFVADAAAVDRPLHNPSIARARLWQFDLGGLERGGLERAGRGTAPSPGAETPGAGWLMQPDQPDPGVAMPVQLSRAEAIPAFGAAGVAGEVAIAGIVTLRLVIGGAARAVALGIRSVRAERRVQVSRSGPRSGLLPQAPPARLTLGLGGLWVIHLR